MLNVLNVFRDLADAGLPCAFGAYCAE